MGYSLIETHTFAFRAVLFAALVVSLGLLTLVAYPYADHFLNDYSIKYYRYNPSESVVSDVDTSQSLPAAGVPILMYHGVLYEDGDGVNTSLTHFIDQMEMLKHEGYETISVAEFDQFREGLFTLPFKPIIITFDDGRKDSYYTTDSILENLGFRATIFIATAKANGNDPFYLSWGELKEMKATGRWEIEAHGRHSHAEIPIDAEGALGRYLTSRIYTEEGSLESEQEYKNRVEIDYVDGIVDLRKNLGIDSRYFAVPLNDYGEFQNSNYEGARDYNEELTRRFFKLAFIEANGPSDVTTMRLPVYNFPDENPHLVRRIEVKNMTVGDLKQILEREYPKPPQISYGGGMLTDFPYLENTLIGTESQGDEGLVLSASRPSLVGTVAFGGYHWDEYVVRAIVRQIAGDAVVLMFHYQGADKYLSCGISGGQVFMRFTNGDGLTELAPPVPFVGDVRAFNDIKVAARTTTADCAINGSTVFHRIPIPLASGAVGFKVWGAYDTGKGVLSTIEVAPLF